MAYGVSSAGRRWYNSGCWLGSFVIFQGIRADIAKESWCFVISQRGSDPLPPPQTDPRNLRLHLCRHQGRDARDFCFGTLHGSKMEDTYFFGTIKSLYVVFESTS